MHTRANFSQYKMDFEKDYLKILLKVKSLYQQGDVFILNGSRMWDPKSGFTLRDAMDIICFTLYAHQSQFFVPYPSI